MEWVETTAKTLDGAKEAALDQLGVAEDEAEFEVLEEPKPGLFGRTRGEGRVRARVRPTQARPKQERRPRASKGRKSKSDESSTSESSTPKRTSTKKSAAKKSAAKTAAMSDNETPDAPNDGADSEQSPPAAERSDGRRRGGQQRSTQSKSQEKQMSNDEREPSPVSPQEVGDAAVTFMDGLVEAFGTTGSSALEVDDTELDVRVTGESLGLLVGPGGRTLNAIQDLARVSAQRRLGDHETRLRIDVAGYRERRSEALQKFAADVAASVRENGEARALEPMASPDRKVIHDALNDEDGVSSRSEGDDPNRRIVVIPD
mgnify:CR=1 FL=1